MRVFLAGDGVVFRQFSNVRTRNERLLARTSQDGDADRGVGLNVGERRPQLFHGGHVERIEHLRPVHSDVSDGVSLFEQNVFEGHSKVKATLSTAEISLVRSEFAVEFCLYS